VKTAIALSGGANLGAMQAGGVVALLEAGVEPDLLVGSSVGALNAAFLANHPGLPGALLLADAWVALQRRDAFRFNLANAVAGFLGARDHLVSPERLAAVVRRWLEVPQIEDAPTPYAVVATDALSGEAVLIDRGDAATALMASSAIPGLLPPIRHRGRWLIDGSLAASSPVLQAQALGAKEIFLVNTRTAPRTRPPSGALAMAMNSVSLLTARAGAQQLAEARRRAAADGGVVHEVPTGEPEAPGPFDFTQSPTLFARAHEHAARWCAEVLGAGTPPRSPQRA